MVQTLAKCASLQAKCCTQSGAPAKPARLALDVHTSDETASSFQGVRAVAGNGAVRPFNNRKLLRKERAGQCTMRGPHSPSNRASQRWYAARCGAPMYGSAEDRTRTGGGVSGRVCRQRKTQAPYRSDRNGLKLDGKRAASPNS